MRLGIVLIIVGVLLFVATVPSSVWLGRGELSISNTSRTENGVLTASSTRLAKNYQLTDINTLVLETFSGNIEIETSSTMSSLGEFQVESSGTKMPSLQRNGSTLTLKAEQPSGCQNCSVSYRVKLGKAMRLELRSKNGDITVQGLTNSLKASSFNGKIQVSNTGKTILDLSSSNGEVMLENLALVAGSQNRIQSFNGGIELIGLEGKSGLEIRGRTDNGSLDNQRDDLDLSENENGAFQATLSGDNPAKLELISSNGDIRLE